jgi:hypothetical protein
MKKKLIFIALFAIAFIACKKETDTDNPVISISSPTEGQMFSNGDSALVAFTITDSDMHGFEFVITNTSTNDTLFEAEEHAHMNVTFSNKYKLPDVATPMKITIIGEDHNGNTSSKSVSFHTM